MTRPVWMRRVPAVMVSHTGRIGESGAGELKNGSVLDFSLDNSSFLC